MKRLKFFLILACVLAAGLCSLQRYPFPMQGGLAIGRSLLLLGILGWILLGMGRALLKFFKVYTTTSAEELVFSFGLGLTGLSAATFVLGSFGVLKNWVAVLLLAAFGFAFSEHLEHFLLSARRALKAGKPGQKAGPSQGLAAPALAALGWAALAVFALALVPPVFYDSLLYHLALPQAWEKTAQVKPEALNLFTWLPSAGELNTTFCLLLDGPLLATLLNFTGGVMLAVGLWDAALRFLPGERPWLAPALCLTQPLAALAFGVLNSDGLATFHVFLSFYAFLHSIGERNVRLQRGWLWLAALLAGAAGADKPVALVHAAALALLALARSFREKPLRMPLFWAGFLALLVLPLLPALVRNGFLTGNPLYPMGLGAWKPASAAYLQHMRDFGFSGPWYSQWKLPFLMTFQSGLFGNGGHLSPLFLGLLPALFFVRLSREMAWTAFYLALGLTAWAFSGQVLRYLLPLMPALALLAGFLAVGVIEKTGSRGWTFLFEAVLGFFLLASAGQTSVVVEKDFGPTRAALGLESPGNYLERHVSYAATADWAASHLDPQAGILVLGESRTAYLPGRPLAATVFETHPFAGWLQRSTTPAGLNRMLKSKGLSYVLVNQEEWRRVELAPGPHYRYYSDPDKARLFKDWAREGLQLLFEKNGCSLYRIRNEGRRK